MIMTEKVKFYFFKSSALQDKIDEQIFELYSSFASIRIKKGHMFHKYKIDTTIVFRYEREIS